MGLKKKVCHVYKKSMLNIKTHVSFRYKDEKNTPITSQNKVRVAILTSVDFRRRNIITDKAGHSVMVKESGL